MQRAAWVLCLALLTPGPPALSAEGLDAESLVRRIQQVMRGDTIRDRAAMTITRPRWTRTVEMRSWDDRLHDRSLIRILSPAKDRGTGFLKIERTLWTYLPRVERTMRMPPSMLLQPWMGSDFSNDDLVRESSLVDDYVPKLKGEREIDGEPAIGLELHPRTEAPVVWAMIEIWVEKRRLTPLVQTFFGEKDGGGFEPIRRMHFSDIREVQGRPMPHHWSMQALDEPGKSTSFEMIEVRFNEEMPDDLFTLANLKRSQAPR